MGGRGGLSPLRQWFWLHLFHFVQQQTSHVTRRDLIGHLESQISVSDARTRRVEDLKSGPKLSRPDRRNLEGPEEDAVRDVPAVCVQQADDQFEPGPRLINVSSAGRPRTGGASGPPLGQMDSSPAEEAASLSCSFTLMSVWSPTEKFSFIFNC